MDAEQWAKGAVRPVIGPGVNRWLLVRRSDDDVPASEVETNAGEALAFWLGFPSYAPSMMNGVKILSTVVSPKPLTLATPLPFRREQLPELPIVAGGNPWYVVLEFSSSLPRTSLPWPVITRDAGGWDFAPSATADWMMLGAEAPRPMTAEETPKSPLQRFEEGLDKTGTALRNVAIAVGAAAAIAVVVTILRK